MKINTQLVSLKISAGTVSQFPRDVIPQIAFSGRSNVGKSSLINTLLGRNSLARVSGTPGKTITVNFYEIDRKLFFVDLPGYGFAQRSRQNQASFSAVTDRFFTANPMHDQLKLVIQLVDSRIGPTNDDLDMIDFLTSTGTPFVIAATKSDKLKAGEISDVVEAIRSAIPESVAVIPFSSVTKSGKDELWRAIDSALER